MKRLSRRHRRTILWLVLPVLTLLAAFYGVAALRGASVLEVNFKYNDGRPFANQEVFFAGEYTSGNRADHRQTWTGQTDAMGVLRVPRAFLRDRNEFSVHDSSGGWSRVAIFLQDSEALAEAEGATLKVEINQ